MNNTKSYNISYLVDISGGDEGFVKEMLEEFVTNAPSVFNELKEQARLHQWNELYASVHRFAPNYDFVGNSELKLYIGLLESASKHIKDTEKIDGYISTIGRLTNTIIEELKNDYNI